MKPLFLLLAALVFASCAPSTPESRIAANPAKYEALSSKHQELVRQGRIDAGMPPDAVALAWGNPSREFTGGDGDAWTNRWEYMGSKPVTTTRYGGGYHYGRYGRYGRYRGYGVSVAPEVTYVPYRRASVWFRNNEVTRWERIR